MNEAQRSQLTATIEKRIEVLEQLLEPAVEDAINTAAEDASGDTMVAAVGAQITENEKRELARLQSNLVWLQGADGGYCQQCGEEIPIRRLQAVPVTRLCINCAK